MSSKSNGASSHASHRGHRRSVAESHASRLIAALEDAPGCNSLHLEKQFSQTGIAGLGMLDELPWHWPER